MNYNNELENYIEKFNIYIIAYIEDNNFLSLYNKLNNFYDRLEDLSNNIDYINRIHLDYNNYGRIFKNKDLEDYSNNEFRISFIEKIKIDTLLFFIKFYNDKIYNIINDKEKRYDINEYNNIYKETIKEITSLFDITEQEKERITKFIILSMNKFIDNKFNDNYLYKNFYQNFYNPYINKKDIVNDFHIISIDILKEELIKDIKNNKKLIKEKYPIYIYSNNKIFEMINKNKEKEWGTNFYYDLKYILNEQINKDKIINEIYNIIIPQNNYTETDIKNIKAKDGDGGETNEETESNKENAKLT